MQYKKITINPLSGAMGAEIGGVDLSQRLDNQTFDEIHQALLENLVIIFHDQTLGPDECKAFARKFGSLEPYPFVKVFLSILKYLKSAKNLTKKEILEESGIRICHSPICHRWEQCCMR